MLAFSNDYYGMIFRATQSVELFCAYVSITADTRIPNNNARYHFTLWFAIIGNNTPAGNSNIQFKRFSFRSVQSLYFQIAFHDQSGINSYWRTVLVLVNTVEPNTIPRNITIITTATAWIRLIFFLHTHPAATMTVKSNHTLNANISYFDHFLLYVVHSGKCLALCQDLVQVKMRFSSS